MDSFANVYNNCGGYDNHYVSCWNCNIYLHFENKKNIVIGAVYSGEEGLSNAVNNDYIVNKANDCSDARDVGEAIWNTYCL